MEHDQKPDRCHDLSGSTNQAIGLAWGWQSLSTTNGPIQAPAKASNYVYKDYIVLLSDGLNTQNRFGGDGSTTDTDIDARQEILCKNVKDPTLNGGDQITVFTIQVNINNKIRRRKCCKTAHPEPTTSR